MNCTSPAPLHQGSYFQTPQRCQLCLRSCSLLQQAVTSPTRTSLDEPPFDWHQSCKVQRSGAEDQRASNQAGCSFIATSLGIIFLASPPCTIVPHRKVFIHFCFPKLCGSGSQSSLSTGLDLTSMPCNELGVRAVLSHGPDPTVPAGVMELLRLLQAGSQAAEGMMTAHTMLGLAKLKCLRPCSSLWLSQNPQARVPLCLCQSEVRAGGPVTAGLAMGQAGWLHPFNSPFLSQVLAGKQPDTFQRTQKMIRRRRRSGNNSMQKSQVLYVLLEIF